MMLFLVIFVVGCSDQFRDPLSSGESMDAVTPSTSDSENAPASESSPANSYTTTVLLGTCTWDVESNVQKGTKGVDFKWEGPGKNERWLAPYNGSAAKSISGKEFDSIDETFVAKQELDPSGIWGTDGTGTLGPGAVIVFRTAEGNFGKLKIDRYWPLHDFSFPEAEKYLDDSLKEYLLSKPNFETYHLQVTWKLF